jgi:hypothetical protein
MAGKPPKPAGIVASPRFPGNKKQRARTLKELSREIPDDGAIWQIIQNLASDNSPYADHAIALIGASYLEKALEVAIRSRFAPLDTEDCARIFEYDHNGPLADLSARIKMAHALGLIGPKTKTDMNTVREIRNAFAHASQVLHFSFPEIAAKCEALNMPEATPILGRIALGSTDRWRYVEATVTLSRWLKESVASPPGDRLSTNALAREKYRRVLQS